MVNVLDPDAGELLRLVMLGVQVEDARSGARPSRRLVELLRDLYEAEQRHALRRPVPAPSSDVGTSTGRSSTVVTGWVLVKEAASLLGCSTRYITELCATEQLAAFKVGLVWVIDRASLEAFRHNRRQPS